ncbi:MAG TPA: thiamine pyrophosphate-dependent dehydrogenase E1 component subunit alpha [Thermoleophilaceae bacterium]
MARETPAAGFTSPGAESQLFVDLYRRMRLIRRFEDSVQTLFQQGLVHGTTHLYSGQEAGAVGVCSVLGDDDRVAATYRGHGAALALGVETEGLMAELLGRATGVCKGRSGSMNVIDLDHRLMGCFSIVGGSIGAATGMALALKRTGGVAVAFFGDGTANQGYFPECLNFARVFDLPVVFVCENNRYGEFTPFEQVTGGAILDRPRILGIHAETIDGNDVWTVRHTAAAAVERARAGEGPQFIESLTYRFVGHSRSDPGAYRAPGELDEWRKRDPLTVTRAGLGDRYGVSAEALDEIDESVEQELAAAVEAASNAPFPEPGPVREFKGG